MSRVVCWFSCGAPSAVAAKLALKECGHDNVVICYQDTGSEHPDNQRFLKDCERWFDHPVIQLKSDKYNDVWEVWEARKYIAGVNGAPCTSEMKRKVAEEFLDWGNDIEVFGYTIEEQHRVDRWIKNNNERRMWPLLIEKGLTKSDCLGIVDRVGIEIPEMYKLGYNNNNCIGCPKGQSGYWNKIRKDFPDVFDRMAKLERKFDAAINKRYEGEERIRVFLDELPEDAGRHEDEPPISCGLFCMEEADEL